MTAVNTALLVCVVQVVVVCMVTGENGKSRGENHLNKPPPNTNAHKIQSGDGDGEDVGGVGVDGVATVTTTLPQNQYIALSTQATPTTTEFNYSVGYNKAICDKYLSMGTFRVVVNVILVTPMIVLGIIGNSVSIMVLRIDNVNNTVSMLLQALAVADNAYLVTCFFMQTVDTIALFKTDWFPRLIHLYPYIEPYVWPCASIAQTSAVWLVMLVTVDRYIAIRHPFKMLQIRTASRAKKAVVVVVTAAILYNIPRFLEHRTAIMPDYCRWIHRPVAIRTDLRNNRMYFIIYKNCMFFMFRLVIPLLVLMYVNIKLMIFLRQASRERAMLTKADSAVLMSHKHHHHSHQHHNNGTSNPKTNGATTTTTTAKKPNTATTTTSNANSTTTHTTTVSSSHNPHQLRVNGTRAVRTSTSSSNSGMSAGGGGGGSSKPKDYFTTILVSVVTVFLICQTPDFALRVAVTINNFTGFIFDFSYFNTVTNSLLTLNSSINCLVYCLTGQRFRKILARQFCKLFTIKRRRHQHHIAMDDAFSTQETKHVQIIMDDTLTTGDTNKHITTYVHQNTSAM